MLRLWPEVCPGVQISRSRPYHKNDNRCVEQKNSTLVRAYLGQECLDTVAQTLALNQLYDRMWLYYNFFQPVMHLTEKIIPAASPGRVQRRYDQARTPFERVCATSLMSQDRQNQLVVLRDQTNPRQLRQEIYELINYIFSLPNAIPGQTEDVYQTLIAYLSPEALPWYLTLPAHEPVTRV